MTDRNPQKHSLEELCILLHFQAVTLTEMNRVLQTHFRAEKNQNASASVSISTALSNTSYVSGKHNIYSKRPSSYL